MLVAQLSYAFYFVLSKNFVNKLIHCLSSQTTIFLKSLIRKLHFLRLLKKQITCFVKVFKVLLI